jgi:lysozyme
MDSFKPALDMIKSFEGCRLASYQDQKGIWTIGWGSTKRLDTGAPVGPGMTITQEMADEWLEKHVDVLAFEIDKLLKVSVEDHEFNSLLCFVYNIGIGNFSKCTLLRKLNALSHREDVADEFLEWDKEITFVGGRREIREVPGLRRRRMTERLMFLGQKYD